jgi:hypothetical protein
VENETPTKPGKQNLNDMKMMTTEAIGLQASSSAPAPLPEFGRWRDVERLFGIKRGTLYNLMAEGKVKSVVLRRKGNIHGCRLFHLASVSQYLNQLLETQKTQ